MSVSEHTDTIPQNDMEEKSAKTIQKNYRGQLIRRKMLPNILCIIQSYLSCIDIKSCTLSDDGRTNSCFDEDNIIDILIKKFPDRIKKPDIRMWYDILVKD